MMSNPEPNFFLAFRLSNQSLLENFKKLQNEFITRNEGLKKYLEPVGKVKNQNELFVASFDHFGLVKFKML